MPNILKEAYKIHFTENNLSLFCRLGLQHFIFSELHLKHAYIWQNRLNSFNSFLYTSTFR